MTLPDFLTIARVARHIPTSAGCGLSHQRASWMLAHLDDGKNRERLKSAMRAALEEMKNEIDKLLNEQ